MKILIIGFGSIGQRHADNAARYASVGVYDEVHAAQIRAREDERFQTFHDLSSAWAWQPDGVIIATPQHTHIVLAELALAHTRHILIEKPIADRVDGVVELLNRAMKQGVFIYMVCNMRFHSAINSLKENLSRIGNPWFARAHYGHFLPLMRPTVNYASLYAANKNQGGGVILDAIHEVDYLQWFFGSCLSVTATKTRLSELEIDVEDYACLLLQHQSGVRSEIHLDYLQSYKRRGCEIVGDQGQLIWQSEGKMPEQCCVRFFSNQTRQWEVLYDNADEATNKPYDRLMKEFVAAMLGQVHELASGTKGLAALNTCLAAHAASLSNKTIYLPPEVIYDHSTL